MPTPLSGFGLFISDLIAARQMEIEGDFLRLSLQGGTGVITLQRD